MKAYELLAKLRHLTLSGYEDGHYEWIGTNEQWNKVDKEMASILERWDVINFFNKVDINLQALHNKN